jgi:uncharacterized protein (TIGR03067 family)
MLHRLFARSPILAAAIGLSLALSGCGRKPNADKIDTGMTEKSVDSGGRDAKPESVEEEVKRLSGLWLLSRQEDRDSSFTVKGLTSGLLFETDKVTDVRAFLAPKGINGDDFLAKGDSGSYKLDVSKNPKTIDIRRRDGTQVGIYKLEKDTLTISWSEPGEQERPHEFNRNKADVKYYIRADRGKYHERVGQKKK